MKHSLSPLALRVIPEGKPSHMLFKMLVLLLLLGILKCMGSTRLSDLWLDHSQVRHLYSAMLLRKLMQDTIRLHHFPEFTSIITFVNVFCLGL